jgi:putative transposase
MLKNRKLSKSISDASWGIFETFLTYKASWNDKEVVKIDRFFPSSKTCSVCGSVNHNLTLKDRVWTCENGHVLDRDINASKNILNEGLRLRELKKIKLNKSNSVGTIENTSGDINKTLLKKHKSIKLEEPLVV